MKSSFFRIIIFVAFSIVLISPYNAFAATKKKGSPIKKTPVTKVVPKKKIAPAAVVATAASTISIAQTASSSRAFEISGWIPYWRTATGTADVLAHLDVLTEVNPFGYTVKNDGTIFNALKIERPEWQTLIAKAKEKNVRVIPTIMWSNTNAIHNVLSDGSSRSTHIASIVSMVEQNNFAGVDIDYESKKAETKDSFSAFLTELSSELSKKSKMLVCTIEARQPLSARYTGAVPDGIEYANDLPVINKQCSRVRIMTYDQGYADVQLNKKYKTELYSPIADPVWVEKVVTYMSQDIDKNKMSIGIATYGYDYQVIPNTDGTSYTYDLLEAFNPRYALDVAKEYNIIPIRNSAKELSFSYVPKETISALPSQSALSARAPSGTATASLASVGALSLLKEENKQAPFHMLWWSDAQSIEDKLLLAKKLGVRGVAVFKFDGGADPEIWNVLSRNK
jgi:spore germination protein YaaH